jgi:putative membrane protein
MKVHFNVPQKQSPIGIVVMFLDTAQQYARALWPILVLWIFKFNELNKIYFLSGTVTVFLVIGIIAYLKYLNFTFYLDQENREFVIHEGVFIKTKTTIQLQKIQQVNINQTLVQKIIGVFSLEVDTAGSQTKEVKIKAITHDLALKLKESLLSNSNDNVEAISDSISPEVLQDNTVPLIKISFFSLFKIGITSNYIKSFFVLLLFVITISDYFYKITGRDVLQEGHIENYVDKEVLIPFFMMGILVVFLIVLMINLFRIIFKYFDFKITKQNRSLLLSYGLLNTKSTILKPEKVQITTITRNYFQKKMDVLGLKIKQASSGEEHEKASVIEIPGCNDNERDDILKLLYKNIPEKGVMLEPNFRKLGFALFLTIGLPLLGYIIFRNNNPEIGYTIDYIVTLYVIFVVVIQFFKFKNNRLFVQDDFIIKQSGAWDIDLDIIEPHKIQAITTSQLFWHKGIDIGSVTIHTAGGDIAFELGNYTKTKHFINLWLYKIEKEDSNWM